jgi:7,8-dihydropterin-6-yl-methyl-4-(beta-D-ribofuranosyl)aminobenzene 5'-phosphate synthase
MKGSKIYVIIILIAAVLVASYFVPNLLREKPEEPGETEETSPAYEIILKECGGNLTILYDNNPYDPDLETEWGFSCLIELEDATILFDTGGDGRILSDNMEKLGVDPDEIDYVVLSHVHQDHIGGLYTFLEANSNVTVFVPDSFPYHVKSSIRVHGADVVEVRNATHVCEGVATTGVLGTEIEEQSLMVSTSEGLLIVTGCSHPGIVGIVEKAVELTGEEVRLVIGGFHLGGHSEAAITGIISDLKDLGVVKIAPCHCTGDTARGLFEEAFGEDYVESGVGLTLDF